MKALTKQSTAQKLKTLQNHHREIARLKFQGFNTKEIAERTGTSLTRVYAILSDPLCKGYMEGLNDKADKMVLTTRQRLLDLESDALDRAAEILSEDSQAPAGPMVTLIKDILDRNGYKAPEKHAHVHTHMTLDDIRELARKADEMDDVYIN